MKLPEIVKRIGYTDGEERIYVEDYVYSYLNGLREKGEVFPVRAALFGHVVHKDAMRCYLIYGACCVVEELAQGKTEKQIGEEFFPEYELIGYVNINKNSQFLTNKRKGYFVFYEANEPMQRYLAFCFDRENRREKEKGKVTAKEHGGLFKSKKEGTISEAVKRIFYGLGVLLLAIAISTVNDYGRMRGFVEVMGEAARMAEGEKQEGNHLVWEQ